ncbi:MAG: hypothetical protein HYX69_04565 [Planctomycetia bacterium]|nr:hypothetical protein [Planctomycetia bacterium]
MARLCDLKSKILVDGVDKRIDDADFALVRQQLPPEDQLGPEDVRALLELRNEATNVCPAFDEFFFRVFKKCLLADGAISLDEQFHLLRMLYGGGGVDDRERRFLAELKREVKQPSREFEALCEQALGE